MRHFKQGRFHSQIVLPTGVPVNCPIEIRTHPITGRTSRIIVQNQVISHPGGMTPDF